MTVASELAAAFLFSPLSGSRRIEDDAPAAGWTAGQIVLHNGIVVVPLTTQVEDENTVLIVEAECIQVTCVAASGTDFKPGSKVYLDVADTEVNQTASGNYYCGTVVVQPIASAEKVKIALHGDIALAIGV